MNSVTIPLTQGRFAIVDTDRYQALMQFKWRAVQAHFSWYAKATIVRNGKEISISMHRFIARTPFGLVCHHINGNSLDNRAENLTNVDKLAHTLYHRHNRILKKFEIPDGNDKTCTADY